MPQPPHHRVPAPALLKFLDAKALDQALAPWILDASDREFLIRCMVAEGPVHHRGANYVLLRLLAQALEAAHARPLPPDEGLVVPMHVPPHLRGDAGTQDYPIRLPVGPLERLAPQKRSELEAMADCLTDGPPQHAVANVLMVAMLGALLEALAP